MTIRARTRPDGDRREETPPGLRYRRDIYLIFYDIACGNTGRGGRGEGEGESPPRSAPMILNPYSLLHPVWMQQAIRVTIRNWHTPI